MTILKPISGIALSLAALLGLSATAFAAGANAPLHAASVRGTVSAVSGSTIILSAKNGAQYTVDTGNSTAFYDVTRAGTFGTRDKSAGSLSGVALGDLVIAKGSLSGSTLAAKKVLDVSGARALHGTVSAVSGSTITLSTKKGQSYTIDTSNSTQFWQVVAKGGMFGKRVKDPSSLAAIAAGDRISVRGSASSANAAVINATVVIEHLARSNS
jgi:hypothetical protein